MDLLIFSTLAMAFLGSLTLLLKLTSTLRERLIEQCASITARCTEHSRETSLSIIVPVYNEANNITQCANTILNAIRGFDGELELIFVDDESTDASLELLQAHLARCTSHANIRFFSSGRSLENRHWVGKSLPCHMGYQNSSGKYLLFLDSDVRLDSGALSALLAQVTADSTEFLSVIPKTECHKYYSWAFYPLAAVCQILAFDYIRKNPDNSYPSASGQIMLFEKNAYEKMGGFKALSDNVSQDVRAAKKAKESGIRQKHILGFGIAWLTTNLTFQDMVKSYSKSILVAVEYDIPKVLILPLVMILMTSLPWFVLLSEPVGGIASAAHISHADALTWVNTFLALSTVLFHFLCLHQLQLMIQNRSKFMSYCQIWCSEA